MLPLRAGTPLAGLLTLFRVEEHMVDRYLEDGIIEGRLDDDAYEEQAKKLATLFKGNIEKFDVSDDIVAAGPQL